ncbi:MAG: glycine cleavage system protein H [marine benthic group bacterium]|jgi:glycine cleavage system H lipoate-binding protein|nr:glycine cleavage system protein H [Candidatus Benthicola marisminoris]
MGMESADIFATKGLEYLIVIGFLVLFAAFWRILVGRAVETRPLVRRSGRFRVARGYHYHRGHSWAAPASRGRVRVGMDDFAQRLLGRVSGLVLPEVGSVVRQGDQGWTIDVDGRQIRMLSPMDGAVEAVNPEVARDPGIVNADPYESGWLLEVRPRDARRCFKNLMDDRLASLRAEQSSEWMTELYTSELGVTLPDGGEPIEGFGRLLKEDGWERLAEHVFLSDDLPS